jgi:pyruvate/2-oxoglutarate/acetoin dehydrogenase E1 component
VKEERMRELTYAQAINEGIREEMRRDPQMVILGEDVGKYGGVFGVTRGLFDEFGGARVRDCPLNEAAIVGFAVGLAIAGRPAMAELEFMDFATFAMDPIVNQAAKLRYFWGGQVKVPLVIRMPIAAQLGFGTQHSQSLEAWFMHVPGLKVVMPSTAYDAKGLIKTAMRDGNPVVFVETISLYPTKGPVPEDDYLLPFGQAEVKRQGKDVTVVALGAMVPKALKAAEELAQEGLEIEVIDPKTLAPLDIETIVESVKKTGRLVVGHLAHKVGGVGAEIAQQVSELAFDYLDAPVKRVAAANVPVAASQPLEAALYPGTPEIVAACLSFRR